MVPIGVSSSYIILFAIYGAFLSEFGAGEFFFKLAQRLTQGMRAAGAKTAVIFSTLLGMISGSAAGNVAVTGTLTIPMMKREGYQPHQAGAIDRGAFLVTGDQVADAFIKARIIGQKTGSRGGESGNRRLHVCRTPAIQNTVADDCGEGIIIPCACIADRHHVRMPGKTEVPATGADPGIEVLDVRRALLREGDQMAREPQILQLCLQRSQCPAFSRCDTGAADQGL